MEKLRKKQKKTLQNLVDKINGVICSRNLYHPTGRYYNAHIENDKVVVEALYGGVMREWVEGEFTDGNGRTVLIGEEKQ